MSLPYVQLTNEEAVGAKRDILSSEINILNLVKKILTYKRLRKQEIGKNLSLKKAIKHSIAQINTLMREIPNIDGVKFNGENIREKYSKAETLIEKGKKKSIEEELRDIQEKLARLNRG